MALHGVIAVNGEPIGTWVAQRIGGTPPGLCEYTWKVERGWDEPSRNGRLTHTYADGAEVLVALVMSACREQDVQAGDH